MLPSKQTQVRIVEALNPNGDAADTCGPKCSEAPSFDAGRIGLQGDFDIVCRLEQTLRVRDQQGDRLRFHQAWRAATEKDRRQSPPAKPCRFPFQLAAQGGTEAVLRDALAHVRVEVAVRALGQAERPVDIEGK